MLMDDPMSDIIRHAAYTEDANLLDKITDVLRADGWKYEEIFNYFQQCRIPNLTRERFDELMRIADTRNTRT